MALHVILGVLCVALGVTLKAEHLGDRKLLAVAKPVASLCFVAVGLLHLRSVTGFGVLMIAALLLSLVGDVLLIWRRTFPAGLVAFLLGHGTYAAAFATVRPLDEWPVRPLVAVAVASGFALVWLWPHLESLRLPVSAYVAVMTVMVWGAWSVAGSADLPLRLVAGALLFYVSDLAVARNRFVTPGFVNRLWGLPLYYLGQVLIASCVR